MIRHVASAVFVAIAVAGCGNAVSGTATWPGARLERAVLTEADFPPGVGFERLVKDPGQGDGVGAPPPMLSSPEGCADGLSRDIAETAERGPGSAAEYIVDYDGAQLVITVLSWNLDLDRLAATADRCAAYKTFFGPGDPGIPMTTTPLQTSRPDALVYEQTMHLSGAARSMFFSFENVGNMAVFGIAYPNPAPSITVKATLPQTFLEVMAKQADRAAEAA